MVLCSFCSSLSLRVALWAVRVGDRPGGCPSSLQLQNDVTLIPDSAQYPREEQGKWVEAEEGGVLLVGDGERGVFLGKRPGGQAETVCM